MNDFNLVRHIAEKDRFIISQKSFIEALQITFEKETDSFQKPVVIRIRYRYPKINISCEAMVAVEINSKPAHQKIFNSGAVQTLQKLAEFGR